MTNSPGWWKSLSGTTANDIWTYLTTEFASGSMVSASTKGSPVYTNGLVNNHAYSILGAYTLSNGVRLVKMSNPWGYDVYTGDWSDNSSKWTSAFRAAVGSVVNENDGLFF